MICGPKSAPVARRLLEVDPHFDFEQTDRWWIIDAVARQRYDSPFRRDRSQPIDLGYFSRHGGQSDVVVHIAGITSLGSLGVTHWLDSHVRDLFALKAATGSVIGVVECHFDEAYEITESRILAGPYTW